MWTLKCMCARERERERATERERERERERAQEKKRAQERSRKREHGMKGRIVSFSNTPSTLYIANDISLYIECTRALYMYIYNVYILCVSH